MHIYVCNGPKYIRKWWTFKSLKVAMDVIFYFQSLVDEVSWIVIIIASSYLCLVERFFAEKTSSKGSLFILQRARFVDSFNGFAFNSIGVSVNN